MAESNDKIRSQLRRWQERLIDLSGRNPLLRLTSARSTRLQVVSPSATELFLKLAIDEKEVRLPLVKREEHAKPHEDPDEQVRWNLIPGEISFAQQPPKDLFRRIRRLYDNARTSMEERG